MKPYYEQDGIVIYHGDCMEVLSWLDAEGVTNAARGFESCLMVRNGATSAEPTTDTVVMDGRMATVALVTDPPYGIGHYETDRSVMTPTILRQWADRYRAVAVFGWPEQLVTLVGASGLTPCEWITWWPTNGACRGFTPTGLWRESECIAVFGEADWTRLRLSRSERSRAVLARTQGTQTKRGSFHGQDDTRRAPDVWTEPSPSLAFQIRQRLHPNEKPLRVMERLVMATTDAGDLVLDPFLGSGTTLVAAKRLGRKAIGVELNERYCEVAVKRLSQDVLQLDCPSPSADGEVA